MRPCVKSPLAAPDGREAIAEVRRRIDERLRSGE
jgi:hypothetical protein